MKYYINTTIGWTSVGKHFGRYLEHVIDFETDSKIYGRYLYMGPVQPDNTRIVKRIKNYDDFINFVKMSR